MTRAVALFVAVALILAAAVALAHGDAAWIEAGAYTDAKGVHCCGPADCRVAVPGELRRTADGWLHVPTGTAIADVPRGVYASIDAQMWLCVRHGVLRCVFTVTGS